MKFEILINLFDKTHNVLLSNAVKAINLNNTIRNWLFGFYIVEYEQNGEDRAKYGEKVLQNIENHFKFSGIKGIDVRRLREYRKFYLAYPQIRRTLSAVFNQIAPDENYNSIRRTLTAELQVTNKQEFEKI